MQKRTHGVAVKCQAEEEAFDKESIARGFEAGYEAAKFPTVFINPKKAKTGAVWAECDGILRRPESYTEDEGNWIAMRFGPCTTGKTGAVDKATAEVTRKKP